MMPARGCNHQSSTRPKGAEASSVSAASKLDGAKAGAQMGSSARPTNHAAGSMGTNSDPSVRREQCEAKQSKQMQRTMCTLPTTATSHVHFMRRCANYETSWLGYLDQLSRRPRPVLDSRRHGLADASANATLGRPPTSMCCRSFPTQGCLIAASTVSRPLGPP